MERDGVLVGGKFLDALLPKDKQWLWKYFPTNLGRQFVTYYLTFGNHVHFVEHTGYYCSYRWRKKLKNKLVKLLDAHSRAKEVGDFELYAEIEMGDFKI